LIKRVRRGSSVEIPTPICLTIPVYNPPFGFQDGGAGPSEVEPRLGFAIVALEATEITQLTFGQTLKARRWHVVRLPKLAMNILSDCHARIDSPCVFSTRKNRPIAGYNKVKESS
jgi:hypothetical protein